MGHLRRDPLHEEQGKGRRVGGDHHTAPRQRQVRVSIGNHPQRPSAGLVGVPPPSPARPRGVHQHQARAARALHISDGRPGPSHGRGQIR